MPLVFNLLNVAIFVAILIGAARHHRRRFHIRTMATCFVLDLLLLAAVEVRNSAIAKATDTVLTGGAEDSGRTVLLVHIVFSIAMLVLWILQIRSGLKVSRGDRGRLPRHALGAKLFLVARAGNLVTAFFV